MDDVNLLTEETAAETLRLKSKLENPKPVAWTVGLDAATEYLVTRRIISGVEAQE